MSSAAPARLKSAVAPRLAQWVRPAVVPLFATTLFLSSFLMFMVEPMVARMVLPILGGVPMVWNGCVVFFQVLLLGGYGFAHGMTRWCPPRWQTPMYAGLVAVPLLFLPLGIAASSSDAAASPLAWLFLALVTSIGPAFFVLSTSASVLQSWFSSTDHDAAGDPYFLYVASNLGSLVSLAAYPVLVEPGLGLSDQARLWAIGYTVFVALAALCVIVVRYGGAEDAPAGRAAAVAARAAAVSISEPSSDTVTWPRRLRWVGLAFVPSSLMLGVTSYLTTDIAPIPLLWIGPLWLYLLTFVLAFGSKGATVTAGANRMLPLVLLPVAIMMIVRADGLAWVAMPLHVAVFFAAALLCHGRLAQDRPAPRYLTEFYFWLSFGGMAGGLFNTLLAPLVFSRIVEYPLALALVAFVRLSTPIPTPTTRGTRLMQVALPIAAGVLAIATLTSANIKAADHRIIFGVAAVLALAAFTQRRHRLAFASVVGAMLLASPFIGDPGEDVLHAERTFFGTYRVSADRSGRYHALAHGTTLHGMQALGGDQPLEPQTYYHRTGPFGQAMAAIPQIGAAPEIAVVGLGVGTLASYATPAQRWTFYEIDPAIEGMARDPRYFTFLERCGGRCRVVLGDARLSLAKAADARYGLIVLDAFSSDAIPVHLMTDEAMSLYLSRLAPHGVLAFHISNRHLRLNAVVSRLAGAHGLTALEQIDVPRGQDWPIGKRMSQWVMVARERGDLGALVTSPRWSPPAAGSSNTAWTDDYSNILSVFSFR